MNETTTGSGQLCIMDHTGDTRLIWDRTRPDEVEAARDAFNKLTKKGYVAYSVKADGSTGTALTEFDPAAEKIILAPAVRGG